MEPLIVIKGAKRIIQNRTILHLDRFIADVGDLVTIVEESGTGKSTLLNMLGLNDQFSPGQFYLFNQETKHLTRKGKHLIERSVLSFLFQDFGLVECETIDFNLGIGLKFSNLNVSDKQAVKYGALKKVNINKKLNTPIYTLSGGEKQRVACARILLKNSKIILADEPTESLDKRNREQAVEILSQQASQGTLVTVVTHGPYLTKIGNKKIMLQETNEKANSF